MKSQRFNIEIPVSSIALGFFGTLLIIFSFIRYFSIDLIRFFIGISGGALIIFFGYFIWYDKKKSKGINEEIRELSDRINDLSDDFKSLDLKANNIENKLINLNNG